MRFCHAIVHHCGGTGWPRPSATGQPEHVQLTEPERVPVAGFAATALRKVKVPEPSARKVAEALAVAAIGL